MNDTKTAAAKTEDESLMKNGNYIEDSAEGVFGANTCPVGDCLDDDPAEAAARMGGALEKEPGGKKGK